MQLYRLLPYIRIARIDHWFKNVFMLPGVVVVLFEEPFRWQPELFYNLLLALLATGFVTSSNYVINEILDADQDALHPVKKNRPIPSGLVKLNWAYFEWVVLGCIGIALSVMLGTMFFATACLLWVMGCLYNIPPIRTKDKPYIDVLSESVNNPLRLLLGWYATGTHLVPSVSLVMAFWMLGAFFMAVKRFAEYRHINDPVVARNYRKSFSFYNEEHLLVSIIYYASAFGLFFGVFLIRYRLELLLTVPLLAGFIAIYIHLGYRKDSPVQYPEQLYKHRFFSIYTLICAAIMTILMFVDIPQLHTLLASTLPKHN